MNGFLVIAEPARRALLDRLRAGECDVSALVAETGMSQPLVSKHLRVLREAGLVEVAVDGRRRVYRVAERPLADVLDWIAPYAQLWTRSLDRLSDALDEEES